MINIEVNDFPFHFLENRKKKLCYLPTSNIITSMTYVVVEMFFVCLNVFGGHTRMSYFETTGTPVLDFW